MVPQQPPGSCAYRRVIFYNGANRNRTLICFFFSRNDIRVLMCFNRVISFQNRETIYSLYLIYTLNLYKIYIFNLMI